MAMRQSTVKWFDAKKGYGFIHHPDGGEDVFVHYTQIESDKDFKTLRTGQTVEFEMNDGPKGLHALSVNAMGAANEEERSDASASKNDFAETPSSTSNGSSRTSADASMPHAEQREASSPPSSAADSQPTL